MSEWKTIETAPKDGEIILGLNNNCRHIQQYKWSSSQDAYDRELEFGARNPGKPDDYISCWVDPRDVGEEPMIGPTHWMPLPEMPENAK